MSLQDTFFVLVLLLVAIFALLLKHPKGIFNRVPVRKTMEISIFVLLFAALIFTGLTDDLLAAFRFFSFMIVVVCFTVQEAKKSVK